ncbi:hypothetical protein [Burkholderia thailandensis]|uniref:Uncharacterized protein n=2 Tax=Burkholderia thailandensis TaxID=57975 RepID=A0AAW9D1L4_BURTH|nr:hypothetical protein [Burkholderia thailandensis]ABC37363.1 conserved hypothetical protein [Burkholderia thailandensis E264]AHI64473.1 hypothetical protein BTL_1995 [Burkholderia thailandensis H0587]AHI71735.1 hypothetical protein BTQ_1598 [Burkholderia thailandensis 2002721723]AHI78768.1 hypothetical protein BTJ_757 [Burkholderia thailandensis E444]AIC88170.1 hypothetical protein BTRA_2279 [Burkholderia thailandensis USAMRU Malaysia \
MTHFFRNLPNEAAQQIDALSRLLYDVREDRKRLLAPYGATDEAALLAKIATGEIDAHPAYEHYLGAKTLADTHETIREQLRALLLAQGA